jgi:hypothetical protein
MAIGRDLSWWEREVRLLPPETAQRISGALRAIVRISPAEAKQFDDLLSVLENQQTLLLQPGRSPTAAEFLNADVVQRSRAAFEIVSTVVQHSGTVTQLLERSPLLRSVWNGYNLVSDTQTYAQALLDYLFDAISYSESWKRLRELNLNAGRYLEAVRKLEVEMKRRVDRLERAKQLYREKCKSANIPG